MKKIVAIVLALVIAMGMCTMSFAADESSTAPTFKCGICNTVFGSDTALQDHLNHFHATSWSKTCPKCGRVFNSAEDYNAHLDSGNCTGGVALFENFSILELINKLVETFDINSAQWEQIEDVVLRLIDFVEDLIRGIFVPQADVEGAEAELETAVNNLGLFGKIKDYVSNLLKAIKTKILAFYAHEVATEVEETEAEAPADTGSSAIGVAAFAAVSVACAAAFVCTKKKEN